MLTRRKSRTYTEDYKLRIVQEAAACTELGELAALLRREGLERTLLERWRRVRATWIAAQERGVAAGELSSLADQRAALEAKIQAREARLLDAMLEELSAIRRRRNPDYVRPPPTAGPWIDTRGKNWKQIKGEVIGAVMRELKGNRSAAVRVLGVSKSTLLGWLNAFGLQQAGRGEKK